MIAVGPDSALPDAEHFLHYLGIHGGERVLGRARTHLGKDELARWPSFAYVPGDGMSDTARVGSDP